MRYLRPYKIFEAKKSVVDNYLSEIGTTRQDVIDVFQGIIDLGYDPKFKMSFLDKDGRSREEKSSGQETPLLLISFKNDKPGYVGGSVRFNNLDYIENLYHSLAMFMSMYKDKCNIEYDLDNMIELELRLQFDTEYDENKVAVTKDEISNALESCLTLITLRYTSNVEVGHRTITLEAKPDNTIGQKLLDQLKASKTDKVASNLKETRKIGLDITKELAKILSERLKKDIRYVKLEGGYFDAKSGLYLFNGDKQEQMIAIVRISTGNTKTYDIDIKRGFLKTDKCQIELEILELTIEI